MTASQNRQPARADTIILALMAGAIVTVARASAAWSPTVMVIRSVCELALLLVVLLWYRRQAKPLVAQKRFVAVCLAAVATYPFVAEFLLRHTVGGSEPIEMLMHNSLLLVAIVLATFSHLPKMAGASVLLSSFLVLFASAITVGWLPKVLAASYGVLGLWWLMGSHWDSLASSFIAQKVERRIPIRLSVIGGLTAVLLAVGAFVSVNSSAVALTGFMPTSGGTQTQSPYARSGVGDGDATVAATQDAMSFGPVESELFLDSDMPTLYDLFNDIYGEPPAPKKTLERNIGLAPNEVQETENQRIAKNQKSGREFATIRRNIPRDKKALKDRTAAAMFYLIGRVPVHLALERFDTFDGRIWTHSGKPVKRPSIKLRNYHGKPWAQLMQSGSSPIHRGHESHAVKIINLRSNRFASPPQLSAVHIDKVDQVEFFGWSDDGVAYMPLRDHIPQLTVVHLSSQGMRLQPLRDGTMHQVSTQYKNDARGKLLASWTQGVPRGWSQVEAIVDRLRSEYVHDPLASAPEDCPDVVTHFLTTGRGPDYLFATTAAILLREQGFRTRLVSGFYAREDRYDHRAGQTEVLGEDAHFWVEVHAGGNTWVAVEPTPGYHRPKEELTWRQRLSLAFQGVLRWLKTNSLWLALGAVCLFVLWWTRVVWLDRCFSAFCFLAGRGTPRRRVLWTLRLLEWRAWLGGYARPATASLVGWYGSLHSLLPKQTSHDLNASLELASQCLYAPINSQSSLLQNREVNVVCTNVRRDVRVKCFQLAQQSTTSATISTASKQKS